MDMPVPAIAEWEWLNWKFPRAVHAGDTVYARWTLTQKRAPVGDSPTAIVVWRVDVHTAGGALCAEGEVGASVLRKTVAVTAVHAEEPVAAGTQPAPRRRRRRRPAAGDVAKSPTAAKAVAAVEAVALPSPAAPQERAAGGTRRRRRRRSPSSAQARNGDGAPSMAPAAAASPLASVPAGAATLPSASAKASSPNPLTRAIRRLRRP